MNGNSRAVVTGVTGCVGQAVAQVLAREGWTVRGLVRRPRQDPPPWLHEQHQGDLTDPESLRDLCQGADLVVHPAAMVGDWGPREHFLRINRDGTRALLDEALSSGAGRFVHVGAAGVFGFQADTVVTERSPKEAAPTPYQESKIQAEELVRAYGEKGLGITVIHPTWVFGPGDRHLVPEMVAMLRSKQLVRLAGGRPHLEVTYSENLAEAIVLAALSEQADGESYLVGDGYGASLGDFVEELAAAAGTSSPRVSLPYGAAHAMGRALEALARLRRSEKRPMLTRFAVASLAGGTRYDTSKITSLGYQPKISLREGIRRTVAAVDRRSKQE